MFRHEKRFENATGIAVLVSTDMAGADIDGRISRFKSLRYERVGVLMKARLIAVKDADGDQGKFVALVKKVLEGADDATLILMSNKSALLAEGAKACGERKPLLYGATVDNAADMAAMAKEAGCPLGIRGVNLDGTVELAEKLMAAGLKDMIIDTGARTMKAAMEDNVVSRRSAIKSKFKPLGFPTIAFPCEMTDDPMLEAMIASVLIAKYSGIVVLSDLQGDILFPLESAKTFLFS